MSTFQKASRSQVFIKLAITGPTGSGKTYSALRLATGLVEGTGKRIAFLDTENDSASLYSDKFDFDVMAIEPPFEHDKFVEGTEAAVKGDYGCLVIDSSSHFWEGILEYKTKLDARPGTNSYTNWNEAGKKFSGIIGALLQSKIHLICCMRSKMDYIIETNDKGKQAPRKVGLAPIMRDGIEYEFTTVFDISLNHECLASKDRSSLFTDKIFQITEDTGKTIASWLKTATPKVEIKAPEKTETKPAQIEWRAVEITSIEPIKEGSWWIVFGDKKAWTSDKDLYLLCGVHKESKATVDATVAPSKGDTFKLISLDYVPM